MTIEGMVQDVCWGDFGSLGVFHINWVRMSVYLAYGVSLSYKQTRNALYRLRDRGWCSHLRLGVYVFEVLGTFPYSGFSNSGVVRSRPERAFRLYSAVVGGIYYRKIAINAGVI